MLKIFHIPLVDTSIWASELYEELSWEEQNRSQRFVFTKDRDNFIVCRGMLRRILANELSCHPSSISFEYISNGKPALRSLSERKIQFNLSHTEGLALIAIAFDRNVGIDIEWVRQIDFSVVQASLTENELSQVRELSGLDQSRAFLHYWTKREALLKGIGIGLTESSPQFDLSHWNDRELSLLLPEKWTILNLDCFDKKSGYLAAVAYQGAALPVVHCYIKSFSLELARLKCKSNEEIVMSSNVSALPPKVPSTEPEVKIEKKRAREESFSNLPKELETAILDVYQPAGMKVTNAYQEKESKDYGACQLELDGRRVVFRVAKTTPTKVGQFVTIWQRPHEGAPYVPFNDKDGVEFIVVSVSDATHLGQFVFDKKILLEQKIMGSSHERGKGAFRVYAPWVRAENKTAEKTQVWQGRYFFSQNNLNLDLIRKLFKTVAKAH